jgi:hypothetical protein
MRDLQKGLGWFGTLLVLAIAVGAGYYLYVSLAESDAEPGCEAAQNACLRKCRHSATESAEAQRCQEACQREADACAAR